MTQRETCMLTHKGVEFIGMNKFSVKCKPWDYLVRGMKGQIDFYFLGNVAINEDKCRNPTYLTPGPACITNTGFLSCKINKCEVLKKYRSSFTGAEYDGIAKKVISGCG